MTTTEAMNEALALERTKRRYKKNPANLRKIRERFKKGTMTLEKQIAFLVECGYYIKHDINWGKGGKHAKNRALLKENSSPLEPLLEHTEEVVHHLNNPNIYIASEHIPLHGPIEPID